MSYSMSLSTDLAELVVCIQRYWVCDGLVLHVASRVDMLGLARVVEACNPTRSSFVVVASKLGACYGLRLADNIRPS